MCGFFSEDEEQDQSKKKPVKKKAEDDMRIPGPEDLGDEDVPETPGRTIEEKEPEDDYDPIERLKKLRDEPDDEQDLDFNGLQLDDKEEELPAPKKKSVAKPRQSEIGEKDFELEKIRQTIKQGDYPVGTAVGIKRLKTGIIGFDQLIEGGLPQNSLVLLAGATGTGKSTFAMNFLMEGLKNGEPGVYITLEDQVSETIKQMQQFGWDVER